MGRLWDIIARWVIVTGAVSGHRPRHHCWLLVVGDIGVRDTIGWSGFSALNEMLQVLYPALDWLGTTKESLIYAILHMMYQSVYSMFNPHQLDLSIP